MESVSAVLLAAGASTRMGVQKLLIEIGGRTVFEIALANHLASSLDGVCAVVPGWLDAFGEIAARNTGGRTAFVEMDKPCDMSDSLKAGWRWVLDNTCAAAVMISLADQPLIGPRTLDTLIEAYVMSARAVCVPTHGGRLGHPVIIGRRLDGAVMALTGDRGARQVLEGNPGMVSQVEIGSDEILLDLDRIEDLERMKARLTGNG